MAGGSHNAGAAGEVRLSEVYTDGETVTWLVMNVRFSRSLLLLTLVEHLLWAGIFLCAFF